VKTCERSGFAGVLQLECRAERFACTILSRRSEETQMLRKFSVLMLSLVLVAVSNGAAQAQRGGRWVLLGVRHIDGRMDSDKIDVGRDNGKFKAIQFRVDGGTVMFERIHVKYLNGESEDIGVRSEIQDGGKTRQIDLPGKRRVIESVSMWYAKRNWRTHPTVQVYGIR
jgi:hypothetical protein